MTPERFRRVKELFALVLPLADDERASVLARECRDDSALAAEVEELLAHARAAPRFLTGGAVSAPPPDPEPSTLRIPGFTVERVLGRGGMGVVYLAHQQFPPRAVAIKCLRRDSLTASERERFRREAEILARLHHPGIAQVHGAGTLLTEHGEMPWIAMEYVRGEPLLEHAWRLELRERIELLAELCHAVEHAHAKGVVHCDLKPSNVLVDEAGKIRVLDFGVARLVEDEGEAALRTRTGRLVGTLAYMSPEQACGTGGPVGARSDVHALGVLAFEILTGRLPYEIDEDDLLGTVRTICEEPPFRLRRFRRDAPVDLETILDKALAKEPGCRYASAGELEADLHRLLAERPILARRATVVYRVRKFVRRNRVLSASAVAVIAALAAGLGFALASLRVAREEMKNNSATINIFAAMTVARTPELGFGEEQRGNLEQIVAMIEAQVGRDPSNRALRAQRARLLYELACLDQALPDVGAMNAHLELARVEREALQSEDPTDLESRTHLSQIYAKLGEAARERGSKEERDAWFARALAVDEELVRERPDDMELQEDLGWSLERLAFCHLERGDGEQADALTQRRLELALDLVQRDSENWKYVYNLSSARFNAACADERHGRLDLAGPHMDECLRTALRLCEMQPSRRDFLAWLTQVRHRQHELFEARGEKEAALESAREAFGPAETLYRGEPSRPAHALILRDAARDLFSSLQAAGEIEDARNIAPRLRQVVADSGTFGAHASSQVLLDEADAMEGALGGSETAGMPPRQDH
jgi:predicted Ser/Thr protein kinase/tetratricopeptide (TPR) repeat protein